MKLYNWSFRKTKYAAFAETEAEARSYVVDAIRSKHRPWKSVGGNKAPDPSPEWGERAVREFACMTTQVYEVTAGAIPIDSLWTPPLMKK
jgi:hypothetical protein